MLSSFLSKLIIVDSKTGKPSYTLTVFMYGAVVVNFKLLAAGISFGHYFTAQPFSGIDYGAAMAGIGGIYALRKNASIKPDDKDTK